MARPEFTMYTSGRRAGLDAQGVEQTTFDLSVKNPSGGEEVKHRSPRKIMDGIAALDAQGAEVLVKIKELL